MYISYNKNCVYVVIDKFKVILKAGESIFKCLYRDYALAKIYKDLLHSN